MRADKFDLIRPSLVVVPIRKGLFQDTETGISHVGWSNAHNVLLAACAGSFMYFDGAVTSLRAYDLTGKELWSVQTRLVKREESNFVSVSTLLTIFGGGRFVAVTDPLVSPSTFQVIDVRDGSSVATLRGMPLAASEDASRVLIRVDDDRVVLVDLRHVLQQ